MQSVNAASSKYYDELYSDYKKNWSRDHLHYGFWDKGIKTHEESLVNTVKTVMNNLDIQKGDKILDAGCGVGGASRYVLDNYDASVIGITYSELLLKNAIKYSECYDPSKIEFHFMDYTNTDFENESFDKIFALESVCYAHDKHDFIKEANRLLKPGGKLVVADGFLLRKDLNEHESKIYAEFLRGWELTNLAHVDYFSKGLEKYGFENIDFIDKTIQAKKSSEYMYKNTPIIMVLCYVLSKMNLVKRNYYEHVVSAVRQKECIERGIWGYAMFVASKSSMFDS